LYRPSLFPSPFLVLLFLYLLPTHLFPPPHQYSLIKSVFFIVPFPLFRQVLSVTQYFFETVIHKPNCVLAFSPSNLWVFPVLHKKISFFFPVGFPPLASFFFPFFPYGDGPPVVLLSAF